MEEGGERRGGEERVEVLMLCTCRAPYHIQTPASKLDAVLIDRWFTVFGGEKRKKRIERKTREKTHPTATPHHTSTNTTPHQHQHHTTPTPHHTTTHHTTPHHHTPPTPHTTPHVHNNNTTHEYTHKKNTQHASNNRP